MADSKAVMRLAGGGLVAALMLASFGDGDAFAARKKKGRKRGKALTVQRINVANSVNVPANQIIEITFNNDVDAATVGHAYVQIRGENATQTGFTRQVFGSFQIDGNVVRFYPRLPTHLRDPSSASGAFYPPGSIKDNAAENAGLQPSTAYQIRLLGSDSISAIRSTRGRPLRNTVVTEFSTASASDPSELYTTSSFQDSPPPQFAFSNPPDRVPSANDQYTHFGGTRDVPNDIAVSVFCTKVPLSPTTARIVGNIELTQTERAGNTGVRRPINGDIFLEQNFGTTLLVHQPKFPLTDRSIYALRVRKSVKDLTEQYDFSANRERSRLRSIYDWLAGARADNPGTPWGELPDPPAELIPDWPDDPAERAILKENVLTLGDTRPDEVDPRVIVMFTTRDEPVSDAQLVINFLRAEDLYDGRISTAEWDQSVPGAASAISTIAGGDGRDGDFLPNTDTTINTDLYQDNTVNWRRVTIPPGVTVRLKGSRPVTIRALEINIQGELLADGDDGDDAPRQSSYLTTPRNDVDGGAGGPGGGNGGDSTNQFAANSGTTGWARGDGQPGVPGVDEEGVEAIPEDGGRGGAGGIGAQNSTAYVNGGGGGGGGARMPGGPGANSNSSNGWNGRGGAGGDGCDNLDLQPLVGGAGGGAGANGAYMYYSWGVHGGAGGGGGGALRIQTSDTLQVGAEGLIGSRGGAGGTGSNYSAMSGGPAGGGGGGSLLLQSSAGFDFVSQAANLDVSGGPGGTQSAGSYGSATFGGDGGEGFVRIEDPSGGLDIPGVSTGGTYDPVGGGVPSFLYSKFADLGVQDPRVLNFANSDILTNPTVNDAIFVEIQMTREHPSLFGEPDLSAIDPNTQGSTDTTITSDWMPAKVHDNTGIPGGAFDIPGYNPGVQGSEYTFPIDGLNGKGYRFVRLRITFQLDDLHARTDPLPYVDQFTLHFQFNF